MEFKSYSAAHNFVDFQDKPENWDIIQECGVGNKVVWIAIDRHRFDASADQSEKG